MQNKKTKKMIIIPEALELAKLQRTSMTEEQIINSYERDFDDMVKHRNIATLRKVLDIGCGIAGWPCFLQHWEDPEIYILDKTKVDQGIYYGFKPKTSFYNSMEIARKNLEANGIPEQRIFTQEATEDNKINFEQEFDLIVSFISCGFHYPVETYLDQIHEKLKENGVLIIDIRKGTEGRDKIQEKFGNWEIIREEAKYWRIKAVKKL